MNKQELRERVENLPLFDKRRIRVCETADERNEIFDEDKINEAICEIGESEPLAFVTGSYNLVQFKDIFLPILDSFEEELEGTVIHYAGFGMMTVFPDREELKEGKNRFGLIAMNSVDCSSSVIVKFCIEYDERRVNVPAKIAGFKKQHTSKATNVAKDYIHFVSTVKDAWGKIIADFPKWEVRDKIEDGPNIRDENIIEMGDVIKNLKLGTRATKHIKMKMDKITADGHKFTLWDAFELALDRISDMDFKSEVHKQRKIDALCQSVFDYSLILQI